MKCFATSMVLLAACSEGRAPSDTGAAAGDAELVSDSGLDAGSAPLTDAGPTDANAPDAIPSCSGPCSSTTLSASFGSHSAPFDRAQHGTAGTDGLHVEAYFGGDPACPVATSPTPDRTLVISGLRASNGGGQETEADGVRASLLDFRGDLSSAPVLRATTVTVTPRFVARGTAVSFELTADFPGGTIRGGFYAPHCASMDGP